MGCQISETCVCAKLVDAKQSGQCQVKHTVTHTPMNVKVLVISGSMGSGKTTVLGEASDLLSAHHVAHAILDLDAIAAVGLVNEAAAALNHRNLATMYGNFVAAGLRHLLLAEAVETRSLLDQLRDAMPGADLVVCRLTAAVKTLERRLRVREPGMLHERFVARAKALDRTLEAVRLENFIVVNDRRGVTDVAREVLTRSGWLTD